MNANLPWTILTKLLNNYFLFNFLRNNFFSIITLFHSLIIFSGYKADIITSSFCVITGMCIRQFLYPSVRSIIGENLPVIDSQKPPRSNNMWSSVRNKFDICWGKLTTVDVLSRTRLINGTWIFYEREKHAFKLWVCTACQEWNLTNRVKDDPV